MDIGVWLRSLSLEQYEAAFRDNAIDADVLRDLTDQDLNKLGVLLGHRRKLLRSIAALDGSAATAAPTPLQGKPPAAPVRPLPRPPAPPAPVLHEAIVSRQSILSCASCGGVPYGS